MSIVGPAVCNPHFTNPNDPFPSIIGTTQTSTATISNADGTVTVTYSINCPQGDFCFQIVANAAAAPGNGNTASQAENHVCARRSSSPSAAANDERFRRRPEGGGLQRRHLAEHDEERDDHRHQRR